MNLVPTDNLDLGDWRRVNAFVNSHMRKSFLVGSNFIPDPDKWEYVFINRYEADSHEFLCCMVNYLHPDEIDIVTHEDKSYYRLWWDSILWTSEKS